MLDEVTVQQGRHQLTLAKGQALLWGPAVPLSTTLRASTGVPCTELDIAILKLLFSLAPHNPAGETNNNVT